MAQSDKNILTELGSVPIGEMVRSMAMAVADAQFALDRSSLMVAEFMSGRHPLRDPQTGRLVEGAGAPVMVDSRIQFGFDVVDGKRVPRAVSLMELGFVPNFYQFVDTVIEVKMALKLGKPATAIDPGTGMVAAPAAGPGWGGPGSRGEGVVVSSTPIDAGYAAAYGFNLELASVFKTKIVPVPPPSTLEERLRMLVQEEAAYAAAEEEKP